jgi:hypothetical protein
LVRCQQPCLIYITPVAGFLWSFNVEQSTHRYQSSSSYTWPRFAHIDPRTTRILHRGCVDHYCLVMDERRSKNVQSLNTILVQSVELVMFRCSNHLGVQVSLALALLIAGPLSRSQYAGMEPRLHGSAVHLMYLTLRMSVYAWWQVGGLKR